MSRRLFLLALCVATSLADCPPSPCPNGTVLIKGVNEWMGTPMCPFDFLHVRAPDGSCCLSKCPSWTKPIFDEDTMLPLMVSEAGTCGSCKKTMYNTVFGDVCCEDLQPQGFPGPQGR